MNYDFQFADVFAAWPLLAKGTWITIQLSLTATVLGLLVAILCAWGKTWGPAPLRAVINAYIELIRNTPFLVQLFFFFFALPAIGLRWSPYTAALTAMVVNLGAYATEIIRAGIQSIPKGQVEAGLALSLRPHQVFRYIILKPAMRAIFPALTSQFILLMLSSAVVSVISADDLTSVAANLQSKTFRSFEIYIVVTLIYLGAGAGLLGAVPADPASPALLPGSTLRNHGMRTFGYSDFMFILQAAQWTILLSLIAFVGGALGGLAVALARTADSRLAQRLSTGFIQVFQGTPLLMQLFLVFFGAPVLGLDVEPVGGRRRRRSSCNTSAFLGEIWRGGIQAVPRGQWEAAEALGLHYGARMRYVVLPQAFKIALPPTVGLHGAGDQGHVAGRDHRLHRSDAGRRRSSTTPPSSRCIVFSVVGAIYFACAGRCRSAAGRMEQRHAAAQATAEHYRLTVRPHPGDMTMTRSLRRRFVASPRSSPAPLLGAWAPASAQTVDEIKKKGTINVGLLVDFPPYGTVDAQNKPDGYDADVAKLFAKDLGVKLNSCP